LKITCLAENTSCGEAFGFEHGLSFFIESKGLRLLFDMGQSELFLRNAAVLGIDIADVSIAVLSHGHYDHGGGLAAFLRENGHAPVYVSRHAFRPHYNGTEKYIGLDPALAHHPRLIFTDSVIRLADGVTLYAGVEREKQHELGSFGLTMVQDGAFLPDDFRHEQYLLMEEDGRRILFSGCSHRGVLDIVRWFQPDVLIGGFHFSKLPTDETLAAYAAILDSYPTEYHTCHCTGAEQYTFMEERMSRLHRICAGQTLIL